MIEYEPGNWGITYAFTLNGSVFPKSFCIAFPCSVMCFIFHLGVRQYTDLIDETSYSGVVSNVLNGFTSILGFLIVFRSQQSYSRWWEGGTLLQQIRGEWFNAYSSLLAFTNPAPERREEIVHFQHKLVRLFSMLYACSLEQVTTMEDACFQVIDLDGFDFVSLHALGTAHDRCEVVLQWIQKVIVENSSLEVIKVAPPILSRVYNQLGNGIVNLNNARKITEFPIPFPLAQMVTFMLVCHWFMTLVVCVFYVDEWQTACGVCFIVVFSFWTINFISLELEMPFGDDANDLPMLHMQRDFNSSLASLLRPVFIQPPTYKFSEEHEFLDTIDLHIATYTEGLLDTEIDDHLSLPPDLAVPRRKSCKKPDQRSRRTMRENNERNLRQSFRSTARMSKFTPPPVDGLDPSEVKLLDDTLAFDAETSCIEADETLNIRLPSESPSKAAGKSSLHEDYDSSLGPLGTSVSSAAPPPLLSENAQPPLVPLTKKPEQIARADTGVLYEETMDFGAVIENHADGGTKRPTDGFSNSQDNKAPCENSRSDDSENRPSGTSTFW